MQILRNIRRAALILLITSCSKPSPEYDDIRELPYDKWAAYGETLPVKKRLDLQMEIVKRSGHPPSMDMVSAFGSDPLETYKEIVTRLESGDRNSFYQMVLYEIDGSRDFKICSQSNRRIVQNFLLEIATDAVRPEDRPDFYSC